MITVVGSVNMDLVVSVNEIPRPGETVLGKSLLQNPGGKGANQAVAAARLGSKVTFIGCIGDDIFGEALKNNMEVNGIDTTPIRTVAGCNSGIALIQVDDKGQNNIVVVPGSNYKLTREDIDNNYEVLQKSDIVILQLEVPLEIVEYTFEQAKRAGCITILNPAPACELPKKLLEYVDILIPNEHELQRITNEDCSTLQGIEKAARRLQQSGVKKLLVTMGEKGVLYLDQNESEIYPANKVDVVDTTAAGDSFLGGFTSSYERHRDIAAAIKYGQLTAAYTIQRHGAQQSLPSYKDIGKE